MRQFFVNTVRPTALLLLLALALIACGSPADTQPTGTDSTAPTTMPVHPESSETISADSTTRAEETTPSTVFARTYAGYAAEILAEPERTPTFAELPDMLSAAEAERDRRVEALLDITLTKTEVTDMSAEVMRLAQMGASPDLLAFSSAQTAGTLASGGYLANLAGMGPLNLLEPAFDRSLIESLSLAKQIFFLFGDATVADKMATSVIWLDVEAAAWLGLDVSDLLDRVRAVEWTVDSLTQLAAEGMTSLDGDAVLPVLIGAGGHFFVKDKDDMPTLIQLDDCFSYAYAAMQDVMAYAESNPDAALTVGTLADRTDGRLAIPLPILEEGEAYRSFVNPELAACIAVPASPEDPVRTGDLLNAYFIKSADTVAGVLMPFLSGGHDEDLLDLILADRECTLGFLFDWGNLDEALIDSVGMREEEFRTAFAMRITAAAKAMEIVLNRLT
ncbi:MAG: hypothetical protein IKD37_06345 [Clostridia bacterium]|nr:hypothetical protein [Clostridia bacterium]